MTAPEPVHVTGQVDLFGQEVPAAAVAKPNPTTIVLHLELENDLTAGECWPDGEPGSWTVDDLAKEIRAQHSRLADFLGEWGLLDMGGTVTVHDGRGNWAEVTLS